MADEPAMEMVRQRTLRNSIRAKGVGLHSGKRVTLTLRPAEPDCGIVFRRVDLDPVVRIPARCEYVKNTRLSTTLARGTTSISTVEHLLSALSGFCIDNAYVDLDAGEVPIMDGSASPFVFMIQSAGIQSQGACKRFIRIRKEVRMEDGNKWAMFQPYNGFRLRFGIDFDHPFFKEDNSSSEIDLSTTVFVREISRARTFGFAREVEMLWANTLGLGGSLDNAVLLDDRTVINKEGLRFPDECVKHKILDVIGDLYLLGYSLIGSFHGYKSGHTLNKALLNKLLADKDAWETVTFEDGAYVPVRLPPLMQVG